MNITVEELKQRMDKGEKINLIDVRQDFEHEEFNIGGQLIPLNELPASLEKLEPLKNNEIILYCRSGNRSNNAMQFLMQHGFTNVRNLTGGMMEWQKNF